MRFRKKPVVIEAVQYDLLFSTTAPTDFRNAVRECYFTRDDRLRWRPGDPPEINIFDCYRSPAIETLEGWRGVAMGDWIIKGVKGEFYPCKPDIFEASYDEVKDE